MTEPTVSQHPLMASLRLYYDKKDGCKHGGRSGKVCIDCVAELLTEREAVVRAEAEAEAATLLAAADAAYIAVSTLIKNHDSEYALDEDDAGNVAEKAILALQSSDAAAALAQRDAETRLEAANHVWELMYKAAWLGGAKSHKMDCICTGCEKLREAGNYVNALTRQLDEAKAPKDAR